MGVSGAAVRARPELKVSIVVPVYNPGRFIEPCIRSVLGQTMLAQDYEVIFVDDGSTDETPSRLDRLSAEHPNVRVFHIAASGAPGRPRNLGIEQARGEYIQFLDADDELARYALERLYERAHRVHADVTVLKFASASISRQPTLFRRDRDLLTLRGFPRLIYSSLGPAKFYRRAFLVEHGIRFPEGWRRLEDSFFTVTAYLRAKSISVAADAPYYFYRRRDDGSHLTSEAVDPATYAANVRTLLERIVHETEPGAFRARLVRRFYRSEMLGRPSEEKYLFRPPEFRRAFFDAMRSVATDLVDDSVEAGLGALARIRSKLLRSGLADEFYDAVLRAKDVGLRASLRTARWEGGRLKLTFHAHLEDRADRTALVLIGDGERTFMDPRLCVGLPPQPVDLRGRPDAFRADVILRDAETALEWLTPTRVRVALVPDGPPLADGRARLRPLIRGRARIDPLRVGPGDRPLEGRWEVWLRVRGLGIKRRTRLGSIDSSQVRRDGLPALLGSVPGLVVPSWDHGTGMTLEVGGGMRSLGGALRRSAIRIVRDGRSLALLLPVATTAGTATVPALVVLRGADRDRLLPARLEPRGERLWLTATVPADLAPSSSGSVELLVRLEGDRGPEVELARATVATGRIRVVGVPRLRLSERVREAARPAARVLRARLRRVYRRLPEAIQRPLRTGYRLGRRIR